MRTSILLLAVTISLGVGCRGQVSDSPPILVERNMFDQEKYDPEAYSKFFADHGAMRPIVEGTVAQEGFEDDLSIETGLLPDASGYVLTVPEAVIARAGGMANLAQRGRERFDIFCSPCHGLTGDGKGMVARAPAGFPPIPNLNDARVCKMPDGQLYATIAYGVRNMPSYAAQVPLQDRWAIVSYVRALELSQISQGGPSK